MEKKKSRKKSLKSLRRFLLLTEDICSAVQMIIRVYLDGGRSQWRDVTIDSETTCTGVIAECRGDDTKENRASYYLAELCMGYERVVDVDERPLEILQQWGSHSDKVQFILRQRGSSHPVKGGQNCVMTESASESSQSMAPPPDILLGTEFSLERLVQIVAMQKEQLDEQQKMLTNKAHHFSSLQQQQQHHQDQVDEKNERLSLLKDKIKEKEAKLMRLKSLKALVLEQGKRNNSCSKELEVMKNNFDKKEHELATVIEKMETLTRKLKELHQERSSPKGSDGSGTGCSVKKEKLQGQIQECNLMNEQNTKLVQQKQEALTHQQKQIADFEQRISQVQARLFSNHQKTKHAAANRRESSTTDQSILKSTSKYKTLPHGLKFADIELMKSLENGSREKEAAATNDKTVKADFAGQSSKSKSNYTTPEEDGKGKSATVLDRRPGSAMEVRNRSVDVFGGISSKTVSEEPSSSGHRISSHLMNHFAPLPYESKHSSTKSTLNPVLSPSDLLSVNRSRTSESETRLVTGSISDSTEILITDPPALTPTANLPTAVGIPKFPLASTALNKTSDSGNIQHMTTYGSQPTETKAVEVRKTTQVPSSTTGSDWKKTVDHVSSSRQRISSSSEAALTSNVNPLGQTVALPDSSSSGQMANAASGERVLSKDIAEKSKMSDSRIQFFLHSRSGAAQASSSSWRKAASFDETLADSHSTEVRLQRVGGSFQRPVSPSSGASQTSLGIYNSPQTSEAIYTKPQKAKAESRTSTSLLKVDAQVTSTAEPQPKSESSKVVDRNNPASGGGDASHEASPSRFPWSSKSKDLKPKPLSLMPVISSASSQRKTTSESHLQSPKLSSSRPASTLASQGASDELKNAVEQKPALDEVDSARAKDGPRLVGPTKASSQLYESSGDHKNKSESEAGEVGPNSKQSSIPQPPFPRTGHRYVPKNITAETYLQKLRTEVVDEHSKSLGQLYGRFSSGRTRQEESVQVLGSAQPSRPMEGSQKTEVTTESKALQSSQSTGSVVSKVEDKTEVEIISKKDVELRAGPGRGMGASVVGPDLERQIHKPIIPRPVRRRMSSGDMSEDYPGKTQHKGENSSHSSGHVSSLNAGSGVMKRDSGSRNPTDGFRDPATRLQSSSAEPGLRSEEKNSFSRQPFRRQGNLKRGEKPKLLRRVSFEPLALLLDASLEGELDLVEKTAREVPDVSASNDEGITALHNAICAGHFDIVKFLVEFGCDVNSPDSDGWTPLHCAASCNNLAMVQFLVEHGACIFATTFSDQELASDKCEEDEEGYDTCSQYLRDTQDRMGFVNDGIVYSVFDYEAENPDELSFRSGDRILVLRKGDDCEQEWWWSQMADSEGYVPRNLLGLFPRVVPQWLRNIQPAC